MAPLAGIRVVECGVAIAGPLAARYLGHLGADVFKVESRTGGAAQGSNGPPWAPKGIGAAGADLLATNNLFNSQKRSIAIELKTPDGQRIFRDLIAASDVFVCNLSLPAIQSLGLDYESLREVNGRLVHLAMPGFGREGPYSHYRSWGPNLSSLSGFDHLTGDPDRPPVMTPVPLPDYVSGYHAVVAILAALRQRDQTGRGQRIDLAQYNATVACLGPQVALASLGTSADRAGNHRAGQAPGGVFPSRGEERWVAITVADDAGWRAFGAAARDEPWTSDPRFATVAGRLEHQVELEARLSAWTQGRTPAEAAMLLQAAGLAAAPVQDQWDHAGDSQLQARGFWKLVTHGRLGIDIIPGLPFQLSRTPLVYDAAAPPFGWHGEEVLAEVLGLPGEDVAALQAAGAVAVPATPEVDVTGGTPGRPWFRWGMPMLRLPQHTREGATAAGEGGPAAAGECGPPAAAGQQRSATRPLEGLRVLDLSNQLSAYGTRLLAALGASVTRIEPPGGSTLRQAEPLHDGLSLYQQYMDMGKSSVVLNLDEPAGQARFRELATSTAVIFESCEPGYLADRGLSWDALSAGNPGLIWTSVTNFGCSGPYRDWQVDDLSLWAFSGMLQYTGYPDRPPLMPGGNLSHSIVGLHGAIATLAALAARDRLGIGQFVDVSAHEALVATAQGGTSMLTQLDDMVPRRRTGDRSLAAVPYGFYQCADRLVSILALFPDHWRSLASWIHEATGRAEVLDERFGGPSTARMAFAEEIAGYVTELTAQLPAHEFCAEAQRRGIPAAPVNSLADALSDPHLTAIGYWRDDQHPQLGHVRWPGPPFTLELSPETRLKRAPAAGESAAG